MSEPELTEEQVVEAVYGMAAEQMQQGATGPQIQAVLVERGLDAESAAVVVADLTKMRREAKRGAGVKNMIFGALWCIGGTVVTVATYSAASNGGSYVVAWGAIIFGAFQFLGGLVQALRS